MRSPVAHKDRTHLFPLCPQEISRRLFKPQSDRRNKPFRHLLLLCIIRHAGESQAEFLFPFPPQVCISIKTVSRMNRLRTFIYRRVTSDTRNRIRSAVLCRFQIFSLLLSTHTDQSDPTTEHTHSYYKKTSDLPVGMSSCISASLYTGRP